MAREKPKRKQGNGENTKERGKREGEEGEIIKGIGQKDVEEGKMKQMERNDNNWEEKEGVTEEK